jgi:hypothetical protein
MALTSSCLKLPNSKGSDFEEFYIGEGGLQYHIKPLGYENENDKLIADITFKTKKLKHDSAVVQVNFSNIVSERLDVHQIEVFILSSKRDTILLSKPEIFYTKREKSKYFTRYSTKLVDGKDLSKLVDGQYTFVLKTDKGDKQYKPASKTIKVLGKVYSTIFGETF